MIDPRSILKDARQGSQRGIAAELLVAARLTADGYHVSFSPCNAPHDLIADDGRGNVTTIQVKLAYEKGNSMVVNLSSSTALSRKHYDSDQFDVFAIVVDEEAAVWLYFYPNTGERIASKVINDEIRANTLLPTKRQS